MIRVGITGGIGSGKSTVCRMLEARGARLFYSDDEAKRLMTSDAELRNAVSAVFGRETYRPDGSLDRARLASEVFGDPDRLAQLNALVHPRVYDAWRVFEQRARAAGCRMAARESAVMPEGRGRLGLDVVVAVEASRSQRVERVRTRDGVEAADVERRMEHQKSEAEFRDGADRVLANDGSPAELEVAVEALWEELTSGPAYPPLPPEVPRWGNGVMRAFGRLILGMAGFRFVGRLPNVPRFVLIGAPHTTNWDFVLGMGLLFALGLRVNWIGKHTIFRPPFGRLMRWMGGVPVDRDAAEGLVEQAARAIRSADRMIVGLAPEGTRKLVERWKTGFYRIAVGAEVPIVLGMIDFGSRELRVDGVFHPTGDLEADLEVIRSRYRGVLGKYPEQFDLTATGSA